MATNKLNLPTITHNQTADVPRDLNALASAIDAHAGVASGLATLGTNGKVPATQLAIDLAPIELAISNHAALNASLTQRGHTILSNAVTSTDETKAATPRAVKTAMDRADAAFTSAGNGKTAIRNAITGVDPRVAVPADPSFGQLAAAVGQIKTGKRYATGNAGADGGRYLTVTGLDFLPRTIMYVPTPPYVNMYWSSDLDPSKLYHGNNLNTPPMDGTTQYVRQGGFRLERIDQGASSAFWIAYE